MNSIDNLNEYIERDYVINLESNPVVFDDTSLNNNYIKKNGEANQMLCL
ncbi:hypothetical protein [Caldisphaera lagunensis]|nr:hypothetical protein [Caldisphaera lagunensis]